METKKIMNYAKYKILTEYFLYTKLINVIQWQWLSNQALTSEGVYISIGNHSALKGGNRLQLKLMENATL